MPPSSTMTLKRIHREIADLAKEDMGDITLNQFGDSLYLFKGTIPGPEGSVYEGGVFHVDVQLGHDYPFSAPKVMFKTRIYHMNISDKGGICIDILKHNWSPALSLYKVMLSLSSLLTDPNPNDPLVPSIANQYVQNRALHDSTARHWTALYAIPPPPPPPAPAPGPSAKSQGKQKETAPPSRSSSRAIERPITIDGSSDEATAVARRPIKRKHGHTSTQPTSEVIDLSSDDEATVQSTQARRTKRARGGPTGSGGATDEVIVIGDD